MVAAKCFPASLSSARSRHAPTAESRRSFLPEYPRRCSLHKRSRTTILSARRRLLWSNERNTLAIRDPGLSHRRQSLRRDSDPSPRTIIRPPLSRTNHDASHEISGGEVSATTHLVAAGRSGETRRQSKSWQVHRAAEARFLVRGIERTRNNLHVVPALAPGKTQVLIVIATVAAHHRYVMSRSTRPAARSVSCCAVATSPAKALVEEQYFQLSFQFRVSGFELLTDCKRLNLVALYTSSLVG